MRYLPLILLLLLASVGVIVGQSVTIQSGTTIQSGVSLGGGAAEFIAHDAVTVSSAWQSTPDPFLYDHITSASPQGVCTFMMHENNSDDEVTAMTYGGEPMTRVIRATDTVGEAGASVVYCLLAPDTIPTGNQEVSIDHTGTNSFKWSVTYTVTTSGDAQIIDSAVIQENCANTGPALAAGSTDTAMYVGVYTGEGTPETDLIVQAGMTDDGFIDWGDRGGKAAKRTAIGSGNFTMGFDTPGTDDCAHTAVAIGAL